MAVIDQSDQSREPNDDFFVGHFGQALDELSAGVVEGVLIYRSKGTRVHVANGRYDRFDILSPGRIRQDSPIRRPRGVRETEDKKEAGHRNKEKFVRAEPSIHTSL